MDDYSMPAMVRRLLAILVAAIVLALGIAARADSIRLHGQISAQGPSVTLREIAELQGPLAEQVGDTVVATFPATGDAVRVSLASVRRSLTDAGVNWGLVSLAGYTACDVRRARPASSAPTSAPAGAAVANIEGDVTTDAALTVEAMIMDKLVQYAAVPAEDLRVTFQPRDEALLQRSTLLDRYEVEPMGSARIGRIPLTVRRYERGQVAETFTVTADVARRVRALVATRTISRGDAFAPGSVELREVFLTDDRGEPVVDPKLLQGQTAATLLREGHVIYPETVQSPVLVQRGELVTVRCVSGLLVVRTVGRASQDGRRGDQIQVRNESTRESYLATVTGRREVSAQLNERPARIAAAAERGE